ncbi:SIR2 family protein [Candidatus Poribacteria bacterium]|nr:SIR2 family protein [Candidatus Poribacteria bacterium]
MIGKDPPRLVHEFLLARNNDRQIPQRIAHLHGWYRNPQSIILSFKDYTEAYGLLVGQAGQHQESEYRWTLHRKLLWSVLATRRVVFVGFSMSDPYLNKMLETVSADLWGWDKSIHFAIMSISPKNAEDSKAKAERLKSEYGVCTVFYEDFDQSHRGLERIVAEIAEACGATDLLGTIPSRETKILGEIHADQVYIGDRGTQIYTQLADKKRESLDWLEQANQRMEGKIDDEN